MSVYAKLIKVQNELKAPKSRYNSFGKYKYRSCEDILEAVKPILAKHQATIIVGDGLEMIGERVYVKAVARFVDVETGEMVENTAYAREEETKKGMDGSQITGTASSYARKYCLNGLLLIDDIKDADTDEFKAVQETKREAKQEPVQEAREEFLGWVRFTKDNQCEVKTKEGYKRVESLPTNVLLQMAEHKNYEQARNAINCVLDTRSLRGE